MATFQRRGYIVCRWPDLYERVLVVTEHAPLWLDPHLYDRLDDDQFEAFVAAWLSGDYIQRCALLGEPDPRDGLKHLAEANERERARQVAMSPAELEEYRAARAERMADMDPDAPAAGQPKPWQPCADCLAPSVCETSDTELCP